MDGIEKIQAVLKNISVIPKETDEEKKAKITEMYVKMLTYTLILLDEMTGVFLTFLNLTNT